MSKPILPKWIYRYKYTDEKKWEHLECVSIQLRLKIQVVELIYSKLSISSKQTLNAG